MRKPGKFRLLSLLRLRKHDEQNARATLGKAAQQERTAAETLQKRYEELTSMNLDSHTQPHAFQAAVAARIAAVQHVQDARVFLESATEEKHVAMRHWQDAQAHVAAIEKLQERHKKETRRLQAVAEQEILDEASGRQPN